MHPLPEFEHQRHKTVVRILLLEDDESFAALVRANLEGARWGELHLECVDTLAKALAKLSGGRFDLVMTDLNVPDSKGLDTVDALARASDLLIIALTGDSDEALRESAIARGAYDLVNKDRLDRNELERLVRLGAMQANTFRSLRDSESRLKAIVNAEPECVKLLDADGNLIDMNPAGLRMIEADDLASLRGRCVFELITPEHRAAFRSLTKRVAQGGTGTLQFEIVGLKGTRRWLETNAVPLREQAAERVLVLGITRDITAVKVAEEEKRRLNAMYAALSQANEAILRARSKEELLTNACRIAAETGGFSRSVAYLLDADGHSLTRVAVGGSANAGPERRPSLDGSVVEGQGLIGRACRAGEAVISNDYAADPRKQPGSTQVQQQPAGSVAVFPLFIDGGIAGALSMAHEERGAFGDEMTGLLRSLAENISFSLGNFRRDEEHRRDEKALRESEARFRSLTGLSSDFFWETDAQHRISKSSHGAGHRPVMGISTGEARWDVPSTSPDAGGWAAHKAMMEAQLPFRDFVFARVDAAGVERHLSISGEPVYGPDGDFLGYRGIGRDLTFAKREERLLRLEHEVTRKLADAKSVSEGLRAVLATICESEGWECGRVFALDDSGTAMRMIEGWSDGGERLQLFVDLSRDIALKKGEGIVGLAWEAARPIWIEDASTDPRVKYVARAQQSGLQGNLVFPVTIEDRVVGALSVSSDRVRKRDERLLTTLSQIGSQLGQFVTRKQAEQALTEGEARFRQTFEMAATGIAHVALDGRYLRVNARLCEILGYEEDEIIGRSVKELSHPDDEAVMDEGLVRLRRGDLPSVRREKRCWHKDGSVVWVEVTVAVARNAEGEPLYDIAVYEDITERKASEGALRRFRAALDGSADMVLLAELENLTLIDFNDTACTYLGYERAELLGRKPDFYLDDAPEEALRASFRALLANPGRADSVVRTFRRKDGRTFDAEVLRRVIASPEGHILVLNARDLSERNLAEERQALYVRYQEKIARFGESALGRRELTELIEDAVTTIFEALRDTVVVYVEPGQQPRELALRAIAGMTRPLDDVPVSYSDGQPLALALEHGELAVTDGAPPLPFGWAKPFRSGALVPVHGDHQVQGALCALSLHAVAFGSEESKFLVTAASVLSAGLRRINSEGRLAFLAQFDGLTGLPNRALLSDRFSQMIVQARRHSTPLGVLFIDLDDFKLVNDTLGHAGGDDLLKETARRLQSVVRPGDTVARISGDEFAVILGDLARAEDAALVAQKILDRLATPLLIRGQEAFVSASIGIAAFPADGDDAEALLGAADAAMYRAKQSGRNAYQFFTTDINQRWRARAQLGTELRRAMEREEFALVYQPKYELKTGVPCAAEALLRWRHPERGMVSPAEFIPVLEETGLIVPVGEWVLRRACEDLNAWKDAGLRQFPLAVNLSARQFRQPDLDTRILNIIEQARVDPRMVELEITESQLMHDPEHAVRTVRALNDAGIRIAIDDFGTGYSSLAYLTRFAVSTLKIDRSFVADVLKDQADAAIVRTIVDMAHTLGFTVIAEGVETEGQAAFLRGLGCEQAQGFFFAKPMPAAELAALMGSFAENLSRKDRLLVQLHDMLSGGRVPRR